jgi:hypothetical protein
VSKKLSGPWFLTVLPGPGSIRVKSTKIICQEPSGARNKKKPLGSLFSALNDKSLAEERNREPKLVQLEPSGHEDSEYIFKKKHSLTCLQAKL